MPSGWEVYYIVFLSAALALGIPGVLGMIARLVSRSSSRSEATSRSSTLIKTHVQLQDALRKNPSHLGNRMNGRFFLAINAGLVLMALALILIPCVGMLQPGTSATDLLKGVGAIVSVAAFSALGLFYSTKKGDLSCLETVRKKGE